MLQTERLVSIISAVNQEYIFVFWKPSHDYVKPIRAGTFLVVTRQGTSERSTGGTTVAPGNEAVESEIHLLLTCTLAVSVNAESLTSSSINFLSMTCSLTESFTS